MPNEIATHQITSGAFLPYNYQNPYGARLGQAAFNGLGETATSWKVGKYYLTTKGKDFIAEVATKDKEAYKTPTTPIAGHPKSGAVYDTKQSDILPWIIQFWYAGKKIFGLDKKYVSQMIDDGILKPTQVEEDGAWEPFVIPEINIPSINIPTIDISPITTSPGSLPVQQLQKQQAVDQAATAAVGAQTTQKSKATAWAVGLGALGIGAFALMRFLR